ncbi:MAG: hypothetical protein H7X94_07435 [Vallitaleaceae bacterium]|nr:hypothetical protein [Vallitaleaceae bacterium]
MSEKNIEMMKKLLQEKNTKTTQGNLRPDKNIGGDARKGFNNKKSGGIFDK